MSRSVASGLPDTEHLTVVGEGKIDITPDLLEFSLYLHRVENTVALAKEHVDKRATRVIEILREKGVATADINASQLICEPHYQHRNREERQNGYSAHRSIAVSLRDPAVFGALSDEILAVPVDRLSGVRRQIADLAAAKRQAMQRAVADGREQAEFLARQLGVDLGAVYAVRPLDTGERDWSYGMLAAGAASEGSSYESGVVTVESRLLMTFYLDRPRSE